MTYTVNKAKTRIQKTLNNIAAIRGLLEEGKVIQADRLLSELSRALYDELIGIAP